MSVLPGVVLAIIQLNGDVGRVKTLQCSLMPSSWPMKGEEIHSILNSFSLHFMIAQILKDALKLCRLLSGKQYCAMYRIFCIIPSWAGLGHLLPSLS